MEFHVVPGEENDLPSSVLVGKVLSPTVSRSVSCRPKSGSLKVLCLTCIGVLGIHGVASRIFHDSHTTIGRI